MNTLQAAITAYALLRDTNVADRLGLKTASAGRLGLALVVGAEAAPALAADLLEAHEQAVEEIERQERYATATPEHDEDGEPVLSYELTRGTRRCLELVVALRVIAGQNPALVRAA